MSTHYSKHFYEFCKFSLYLGCTVAGVAATSQILLSSSMHLLASLKLLVVCRINTDFRYGLILE